MGTALDTHLQTGQQTYVLPAAFRRRLREYIPDVEAVAFNFGAGNFKLAQQYLDLYPEMLQEYTSD